MALRSRGDFGTSRKAALQQCYTNCRQSRKPNMGIPHGALGQLFRPDCRHKILAGIKDRELIIGGLVFSIHSGVRSQALKREMEHHSGVRFARRGIRASVAAAPATTVTQGPPLSGRPSTHVPPRTAMIARPCSRPCVATFGGAGQRGLGGEPGCPPQSRPRPISVPPSLYGDGIERSGSDN